MFLPFWLGVVLVCFVLRGRLGDVQRSVFIQTRCVTKGALNEYGQGWFAVELSLLEILQNDSELREKSQQRA